MLQVAIVVPNEIQSLPRFFANFDVLDLANESHAINNAHDLLLEVWVSADVGCRQIFQLFVFLAMNFLSRWAWVAGNKVDKEVGTGQAGERRAIEVVLRGDSVVRLNEINGRGHVPAVNDHVGDLAKAREELADVARLELMLEMQAFEPYEQDQCRGRRHLGHRRHASHVGSCRAALCRTVLCRAGNIVKVMLAMYFGVKTMATERTWNVEHEHEHHEQEHEHEQEHREACVRAQTISQYSWRGSMPLHARVLAPMRDNDIVRQVHERHLHDMGAIELRRELNYVALVIVGEKNLFLLLLVVCADREDCRPL